MRHVGSFYAADRSGYTPYLFSQQNGGGPSAYFHDLSTIYCPDQNWYLKKEAPDWERLVATYDYLIVSKPWSAERIDWRRLELHFENGAEAIAAAALSRLARDGKFDKKRAQAGIAELGLDPESPDPVQR